MRLTDSQLRAISDQQDAGISPEALKVPPSGKRKRDNREHQIQKACVEWWTRAAAGFGVDHRLLYAVPNGALMGRGVEAAIRANILKSEGLRPGWPDVAIDVARGGYHGLRLETKVPGKDAEPHQEAIHRLLRQQGYWMAVVHSVEEFMQNVTEYFFES